MPSEPSAPPTERLPRRFKQTAVSLPEADAKELKHIAIEQETTVTALLAEGAAVVLEKYGRPVSADLRTRKKLGRPPKGRV